ncbi:MAG: FHA domain-containing protein [Muribaculaceae bacterium]|nr:FHA domain-containing protein [Muribaculaceae bacterium]
MTKEFIIGRQGNQKMPINDGSVSRQHCKVTDNGDGTYTIENISSTGVTKVDGREIIKTKATLNSRIQLGPTFSATLVELIGAQSCNDSPTPGSDPKHEVKTYSISGLKHMWEENDAIEKRLGKRNRELGIIRSSLGIFSLGGILSTRLIGDSGFILTGIGLAGTLYSLFMMKNIESSEDTRQRRMEYRRKWVCPNPECGKALNFSDDYYLLKSNYQSCPYCKCKYVE